MAAPAAARPGGLVSSTGLTLATRFAAFFFSLATNVILARTLGPEGRGVYAVAILVPALIGLAAQLGIGPANVYYISKGLIDADDLIGHAAGLAVLFGTACYAAVVLYVWTVGGGHFIGIGGQFVLVSCLALPFTLLTAFVQGLLTGAQRFALYNVTLLAQYALPTFTLALIVLILRRSTMGAVGAWTASAVLCGVVSAFCGSALGRFTIRLRRSTLRQLLRFGAISYLGSLTSFVNYRFDILIVNLFAGARQVGLYSVGTGLAEIVWYLANSAGILLAPRVAASDAKDADRLTESVGRVVAFLAVIMGMALAVSAPLVVVAFFGPAFAESVWAVWLLLPGIVTFSVGRILSMYLLGRNRLKVDLAASLVGLVITLVLDLALIPHYGFRGAAVASSIAYAAAMLVDMVWVVRHSTIKVRAFLVVRKRDLLTVRIRATTAASAALASMRSRRNARFANGE